MMKIHYAALVARRVERAINRQLAEDPDSVRADQHQTNHTHGAQQLRLTLPGGDDEETIYRMIIAPMDVEISIRGTRADDHFPRNLDAFAIGDRVVRISHPNYAMTIMVVAPGRVGALRSGESDGVMISGQANDFRRCPVDWQDAPSVPGSLEHRLPGSLEHRRRWRQYYYDMMSWWLDYGCKINPDLAAKQIELIGPTLIALEKELK